MLYPKSVNMADGHHNIGRITRLCVYKCCVRAFLEDKQLLVNKNKRQHTVVQITQNT